MRPRRKRFKHYKQNDVKIFKTRDLVNMKNDYKVNGYASKVLRTRDGVFTDKLRLILVSTSNHVVLAG